MKSESPFFTLILASSSPYRKALLQRLALPFQCHAPETEEIPGAAEQPRQLVSRLATEKAQSVAARHPDALVIGSDQVAVAGNRVIGKPGNHRAAQAQLRTLSGREVDFLTAVSVVCRRSGFKQRHVDHTRVCFRHLQEDEIERYLQAEKPYDCAGSFKSESLGVVLFERIVSEDPTALIGLPLIGTAAILRQAGLPLP